jgi:hypothetical protein
MPLIIGQRCALTMLTTAGREGVAQALLSAGGPDTSIIACLATVSWRPLRPKRSWPMNCRRRCENHWRWTPHSRANGLIEYSMRVSGLGTRRSWFQDYPAGMPRIVLQ